MEVATVIMMELIPSQRVILVVGMVENTWVKEDLVTIYFMIPMGD